MNLVNIVNLFKDFNPLRGQDPHITKYDGKYLLCESVNEEKIVISQLSDDLTQRVSSKTVWQSQEQQVWAPELHTINGMWLIYYTSSDGNNKNHRAKVLGPAMYWHGPYQYSQTLVPDSWSIDMTVFPWKGQRYAVWSGWENNNDEFPQHLYIAPLIGTTQIGKRV